MAATNDEYWTEYSAKEISEGMVAGELIKVNGTPTEIHHTMSAGPRHSYNRPDDLQGCFRLVLTGGFKYLKVWCWADGTQSYMLWSSDGKPIDVESVELFVDSPGD